MMSNVTRTTYNSKPYARAFFERVKDLHIRAERTFIEKMNQAERPVVLDAGCGPGRDTARFLSAGLETLGVDKAETLLRTARDNLGIPSKQLLCSDLRQLPFMENKFNGIWLRSVLGHFIDPENLVLLKELARVAAPGALVFVRVREGSKEGIEERDGFSRFYKYYEREEIRALMQNAGFQVSGIISLADSDPEKFNYRQLNVWGLLPANG